jgi:hypothetical protein
MRRGNPDKIIGKGFDNYPEHINKKGRPKKLPPLDKLLADVLGTDGESKSEAEKIIEALMVKALKGDTRAAEILLERGYGKVKQELDVKGSIELHFDMDDKEA